MSAFTTDLMTNHHHDFAHHPIASISDVLHTWQQRSQRRAELVHLSDRDFHDVGASWSDFAYEANKPFWRE
jgi:uncharacterized protein YjiS (DUF1127 family)